MSLTLPDTLDSFLNRASHWFYQTPERALERAYRAAVTITDLENQHFNGQPIGSTESTSSVNDYFCIRRDKLLQEARIRLAEFRWAMALLGNTDAELSSSASPSTIPRQATTEPVNNLIAQLGVVDQVLARYKDFFRSQESELTQSSRLAFDGKKTDQQEDRLEAASKTISPSQKTGIIPRSILRTGQRLQRDFNPKQRERVLEEYQISSYRTKRAVRFLLILALIPLLTQQVSKRLIFAPIVELIAERNHIEMPLYTQLEREAIEEIDFFEKQIRFESSVGIMPPLSYPEIQEMVMEKTQEIKHEFSHERLSSVENVFADLLAAGVFAWILFANPRAVRILKSFMDDIVYGLSDSAKAFLIIVATDMFVGFHSTHGWEVLLEGVARHLGLPENRDFIFLFIATFPVILDAIFKYWIFRYLSRVSPSAVATYRNMNE